MGSCGSAVCVAHSFPKGVRLVPQAALDTKCPLAFLYGCQAQDGQVRVTNPFNRTQTGWRLMESGGHFGLRDRIWATELRVMWSSNSQTRRLARTTLRWCLPMPTFVGWSSGRPQTHAAKSQHPTLYPPLCQRGQCDIGCHSLDSHTLVARRLI